MTCWNACRELHDDDESEATEELEDEHSTQHSTQGSFGRTSAGEGGFLWWCAGLSCSWGRARQGVGTAGKGSSDNSDPQICHRKHPPSRQPRDRPVLLTAIQGHIIPTSPNVTSLIYFERTPPLRPIHSFWGFHTRVCVTDSKPNGTSGRHPSRHKAPPSRCTSNGLPARSRMRSNPLWTPAEL